MATGRNTWPECMWEWLPDTRGQRIHPRRIQYGEVLHGLMMDPKKRSAAHQDRASLHCSDRPISPQ